MQKSERHAGAEAPGVTVTLEFYYPQCRRNKCPLPGSIQAAPRFHWINNPLKYFTFISSGWPAVSAHIAVFESLWVASGCPFFIRSGGKVIITNFKPPEARSGYSSIILKAKKKNLNFAGIKMHLEQVVTATKQHTKPQHINPEVKWREKKHSYDHKPCL